MILPAPRLQEALLAAEELAWDKKMSALRQPVNKGPSPGNIQVEQTEDDPEVSFFPHCVISVPAYLALLAPCARVQARVSSAAQPSQSRAIVSLTRSPLFLIRSLFTQPGVPPDTNVFATPSLWRAQAKAVKEALADSKLF